MIRKHSWWSLMTKTSRILCANVWRMFERMIVSNDYFFKITLSRSGSFIIKRILVLQPETEKKKCKGFTFVFPVTRSHDFIILSLKFFFSLLSSLLSLMLILPTEWSLGRWIRSSTTPTVGGIKRSKKTSNKAAHTKLVLQSSWNNVNSRKKMTVLNLNNGVTNKFKHWTQKRLSFIFFFFDSC